MIVSDTLSFGFKIGICRECAAVDLKEVRISLYKRKNFNDLYNFWLHLDRELWF